MTPRYLLMLAVVLGPFGCDPDPARGPKPEVGTVSQPPGPGHGCTGDPMPVPARPCGQLVGATSPLRNA